MIKVIIKVFVNHNFSAYQNDLNKTAVKKMVLFYCCIVLRSCFVGTFTILILFVFNIVEFFPEKLFQLSDLRKQFKRYWFLQISI